MSLAHALPETTLPPARPSALPTRSPARAVDDADRHPFVDRVRAYADEVLRPTALRTDAEGVDRARVEELADLGLLNHTAPVTYGGAALGPAEDRRVHELIAGACFNTWLVWAQHAPLVGRLAAKQTWPSSPTSRSPFVDRVLRGQALVGAGVSDVRRFPERYVAADRVEGGWRFRGTLSWVSGWGLHDALTVAAVEPQTGRVVTGLVRIDSRTLGQHLHLSVVPGSRTQRVVLEDASVPDDHVLSVQPMAAWRRDDVDVASDARPHHFGLAQTVLRELSESGDPLAVSVADTWEPRIAELRRDAYRLADAVAAPGQRPRIEERLVLKVRTLEAVGALTRALVAARSGHGLVADDTAQLHARSALFVQVQGQSPAVRTAQLEHFAR